MAQEQKTSIDLVTVELSEEKLNEIKEHNSKLNQFMNQLGQAHIRKNELHEELQRLDEAVRRAEEEFKTTNGELRKELNKLERDYPRGQLDLEKGTVTYNKSLKEQMQQQQQQQGQFGATPNGIDGGDVDIMNDLSQVFSRKYIRGSGSVNKVVVVYAGRFQPFHKGHLQLIPT
jgi:chromosome segregation ATPase